MVSTHITSTVRAQAQSTLSTSIRKPSLTLKHFQAENVTYTLADIRTEMPEGVYDNVVWDGAIEHSTEDEIASLSPT